MSKSVAAGEMPKSLGNKAKAGWTCQPCSEAGRWLEVSIWSNCGGRALRGYKEIDFSSSLCTSDSSPVKWTGWAMLMILTSQWIIILSFCVSIEHSWCPAQTPFTGLVDPPPSCYQCWLLMTHSCSLSPRIVSTEGRAMGLGGCTTSPLRWPQHTKWLITSIQNVSPLALIHAPGDRLAIKWAHILA